MRANNKDLTMLPSNPKIILLLIMMCLANNITYAEYFESDYSSIINMIFYIYLFINVIFD